MKYKTSDLCYIKQTKELISARKMSLFSFVCLFFVVVGGVCAFSFYFQSTLLSEREREGEREIESERGRERER